MPLILNAGKLFGLGKGYQAVSKQALATPNMGLPASISRTTNDNLSFLPVVSGPEIQETLIITAEIIQETLQIELKSTEIVEAVSSAASGPGANSIKEKMNLDATWSVNAIDQATSTPVPVPVLELQNIPVASVKSESVDYWRVFSNFCERTNGIPNQIDGWYVCKASQ